MYMELEQQLESVSATLTPVQWPLSWPLESWDVQAPALDLPDAPPAEEDHLLDGLLSMLEYYPRDLESYIRVQQALLPEQPPALAKTEMAVRYLPMMGVSGDYYDFLPLHEGQVGLAVGDVCGKGMEAALLMLSVCAVLRAQVQTVPAAGELLAHLNTIMCRYTPKHQFMTLAYGIWDASAHTFTYSRAGHPPVLHYQASTGRVSKLNAGSIVLGVYEEIEYPTESVSLERGDALVLYTDGITEASNADDEIFGIDRLGDVVAAHGGESPEALATAILTTASQFAHQGWEDDVTLVVVKTVEA